LWQPGLACERVAYRVRQRRRLSKLRGTVAQGLTVGHIESLELLELAKPLGIRTVYDIGASVGTWSLLAKAVIPDARVEAFEPLPAHCAKFDGIVRSVPDVHLHRIALGAENSPALLQVTDFSDASSLLPLAEAGRSAFGLQVVEQVPTTVCRLDDYRKANMLPAPDLIKLDVQGYELAVLKGGIDCVRSAKAVITEVSFREYYEGQCLFHDLVHLLADIGMSVAAFGEHARLGQILTQADALFLRRDC
jgi:FkbM family methyltransferase